MRVKHRIHLQALLLVYTKYGCNLDNLWKYLCPHAQKDVVLMSIINVLRFIKISLNVIKLLSGHDFVIDRQTDR